MVAQEHERKIDANTSLLPVTVEGRTSCKRTRIRKLKNDDGTLPETAAPPQNYLENDENESMCQVIASDCIDKMLQSHPRYANRIFVNVKNEYQVSKCVCTTIKPELLPYPEIHDAANCADFVAQYFDYEPLEDPTKPPENIPSPSQIISWGIGDCFDISFVLASFLIGAGYDAYVVYGTAPHWICSRDRSKQSCPEKRLFSTEAEDEEKILNILKVMESGNNEETSLKDFTSLRVDDGPELEKDAENDHLHGKRVHCWVLVKTNARCSPGVEDFYIEPTTGQQYHPSSSPYISIYAMWNTHNYWVNKAAVGSVEHVHFEGDNEWEPIFFNKGSENCYKLTGSSRMPFNPPFSWVQRLSIPEDSFASRYSPTGRRDIRYKQAKVQMFSEGVHKQGLRRRITYFKDDGLLNPSHCTEYFHRCRKDGLKRRIKMSGMHCFHEYFSHLNQSAIEEWIEFPGVRRKIVLNGKRRPDGLISCDETFGRKIIHSYEDRRDRLLQRVIFLTWTDDLKQKSKNRLILASGDGNQNTVVEKIVEKYKRPFNCRTGQTQIARRTLCFQGQTLETEFFDNPDGVVKEKTIHFKERSKTSLAADDDDLNHHQEIVNIEKGIITGVRNLHQEVLELYRLRRREEGYQRDALCQPNDNESTASARSRSPATIPLDNEMNTTSSKQHYDYLSPYLISVHDLNSITVQEALRIREECVSTMKERLLERTNIIQKRLLEENERLHQYQSSYQPNIKGGGTGIDEFEKTCSDISFKIKILEKRLQAQEDTSLEKLRALETKLDKDPRLNFC